VQHHIPCPVSNNVAFPLKLMQNEDFAEALRSLDAPYFLDGEGSDSLLGTRYGATTPDGVSVSIVRLHDRIVTSMRDVNAFVGTLGSRAHQSTSSRGLLGAGITPGGGVFVVGIRDDGPTLADRLSREAIVSSTNLHEIAIQCATLLDSLSEAGACHGLIMPQTLLLDAQGKVTLRWGGLFTALRASGMSAVEIARLFQFGSYIAPELVEGAPESVQTDVFSLGATLYEALTGRPPFGGRTTATVMAAVLADSGEPREYSESDALRAAILRAIERDPHDRWRGARQFREALVPALGTTATAAVKRSGCFASLVLLCAILVILTISR
jgi:hypothetical protein